MAQQQQPGADTPTGTGPEGRPAPDRQEAADAEAEREALDREQGESSTSGREPA